MTFIKPITNPFVDWDHYYPFRRRGLIPAEPSDMSWKTTLTDLKDLGNKMLEQITTSKTEGGLVYKVSVAGYSKDDIKVSRKGSQITVVCSKNYDMGGKTISFSISNPEDLISVKMSVENGLLKIKALYEKRDTEQPSEEIFFDDN